MQLTHQMILTWNSNASQCSSNASQMEHSSNGAESTEKNMVYNLSILEALFNFPLNFLNLKSCEAFPLK